MQRIKSALTDVDSEYSSKTEPRLHDMKRWVNINYNAYSVHRFHLYQKQLQC